MATAVRPRVRHDQGMRRQDGHRLDSSELDLVRDLVAATLSGDGPRFDDLVHSSGLADDSTLRADVVAISMWVSYYAMVKRRLTLRLPKESGREAAVARLMELPVSADLVDRAVAEAGF